MSPVNPTDRLLWQTPALTVGRFFAPPDHPRFNNSGPIQQHLFVLPRTSVWIQHESRPPFVSAPTQVNFYNRRQRYRRAALSQAGDLSHWFAPAQELVLDAVRKVNPRVDDQPDRPFPIPFARLSERTKFLGRQIIRYLETPRTHDPELVEEVGINLLDLMIQDVSTTAQKPASSPPAHRQLAEAAKAHVARHFAEPMPLADLAACCQVSVSHLCRVFRQETGTTIHSYRHRLRLFAALDRLDEAAGDLTGLALDLGFSSHSHFTAAFRQSFGVQPSALWRHSLSSMLRQFVESNGR